MFNIISMIQGTTTRSPPSPFFLKNLEHSDLNVEYVTYKLFDNYWSSLRCLGQNMTHFSKKKIELSVTRPRPGKKHPRRLRIRVRFGIVQR